VVSATDLTTGADGTALGNIDAAFSAYAASFDLLAANLSQVAAPSTVTHNGGLCPSGEHLLSVAVCRHFSGQ
jgi:hypothetical protein